MRSKRTYKNVILNFITQICAVIVGFVIPMFILRVYGSEINGFNNSLNQFLGYFQLVEGGMGTASIIALYGPLANSDINDVCNIFYSTDLYLKKAGIVFLTLLVGLMFVYPAVVRSSIHCFDIVLSILIVGISRVIDLALIEKYRVILTADQKIGIYSCSQILGYMLNVFFVVLSVLLGVDFIILQIFLLVSALVRFVFIRFICKKFYMFLFDANNNVSFSKVKIPHQSAAMIHQITFMVAYNTDLIVLSVAATLSEVSVYSVYMIVFNGVSSFLGVLHSVLSPAFGDLLVRGERETLNRSFSVYEFTYYAFCSVLVVGITLFIEPFIYLYIGQVSDYVYWNESAALLFIIVFVLNHIRMPGSALINAAGHLEQTQWFFITEAVLNLVISIILVKPLGMIGCLIGTVFSGICRLFYITFYSKRNILDFSLRKMIKRVCYNTVLCILAWNVKDAISKKILSWNTFFISGIVVAAIVFLIEFTVCFIFDREETDNVIHYICIILGKGKNEQEKKLE